MLKSATPDPDDVVALRQAFDLWYLRYPHADQPKALPTHQWGPARLDAVGMIFNRLTGLDLGPPPSYLIADNIKVADAPVRYPFLWNAPIQDKTQWPGFADNGNDILALSRNLGEVFGVFGIFEPTKNGILRSTSSTTIRRISTASASSKTWSRKSVRRNGRGWSTTRSPPRAWRSTRPSGRCADCHGIKPGVVRFFNNKTWKTPIQNVGTDTKRIRHPGMDGEDRRPAGRFIPLVTAPLKETDLAFNVLAISVIGSIAEQALRASGGAPTSAPIATAQAPLSDKALAERKTAQPAPQLLPLPPELRDLRGAFHGITPPPAQLENFSVQGLKIPAPAAAPPAPPHGAYEARVLQGIWAAAPYLHNGSVPSLAELLKPAAQRVKTFKVGPAYDIVNVGLAADQTAFDYTLVTTDCSNLNSGDSNCGHDGKGFGTDLSDDDKRALLEYLKTL